MKKLISVLIIAFFWLGSTAQTFTNVNNYQNVSGFELVKYFGIPYGATPTHNGVIPVINGVTGRPPGALFYNTTDSSLYGYTGSQWLKIAGGGSGPGGKDTVLVKDDLTVTFDSTGHQVLGRLRNNGIVSGGIVTRAACLSLDVTTVVISLNGMTYLGSGRTLTVTPADGSFPRTDEVIADTTGNVFIRDGTPSSTPVPAPINPSKEVVLTTYTIAAGASCIGIMSETVYDENTEWTTSHGGTMTVNFNNTANPYHLTKAAFVSVYNDGSSLIFTRTGNDTAQANEILKLFVYLNNRFSNQFQISIFNGSTQVGNTVTFNSGFGLNPFDTLIYQNVSIPFSAFNITNQVFNKIVITFAGNDLSGASGLYIDYIQLQTGVSNFSDGHGVFNFALNTTSDSAILTRDDGTVFKIKLATGGGSQDLQSVLDIGNFATDDLNIFTTAGVGGQVSLIARSDSSAAIAITGKHGGQAYLRNNFGTTTRDIYLPNGSGVLGRSINGNPFDSTGNITISTGAGTVTNVAALTLGTSGTDLSSSVANPTTTPTITLNVPTASATNRGALSSTDWTTFNGKLSTVDTTNIANFSVKVRSLFGATSPIVYSNGTFSLANTAVTPGSYTNLNATIDAQGRITAASNGSGGSTPNLLTVSRVGNTIDSLNFLPQTNATPNPPTGNVLFDSAGINYRAANGLTINLTKVSLTANRRDSFPDKSGTFALTSDLPTTDYQYQTASGSTNYTFTNVPASMNDYMISVNGSRLRQTDYTTIGNVITIPSVVSGDQIIFQRIK